MKKALSIAWKILKGYAIANTAAWAFIGSGRYFSDYLYKCKVLRSCNPMEEIMDEFEEAFEGYKDLIEEVKGLF